MPKNKGGFYAVRKGMVPGIYHNWTDCETQTKGFSGAAFKKFHRLEDAESFMKENASSDILEYKKTTIGMKRKEREFSPVVEYVSGWDIVYSDGACKGNGKPGSIAGIGVWWGPNDPRNLAERCPGDQTNNRAELIAILRILETTPSTKNNLLIRTDSNYSIQCFESWIYKWKNNHWKTTAGEDVKNAGIIRCISMHLDIRAQFGQKIRFEFVKGHSQNAGNDGADLLANRGALLPATVERDWALIEAQLERLSAGEAVPRVLTEASNKVRKVSEESSAFSISKIIAKNADHNPSYSGTAISPSKSIQLSSITSNLSTSAMNQVPCLPLSPASSGTKSPLKVISACPPLVPVLPEDVNFDDYVGCLLDDADLAHEVSV